MIQKRIYKVVCIVCVIVLSSLACGFPGIGNKQTSPTDTLQSSSTEASATLPPTIQLSEDIYPPEFSDYPVLNVRMPQQFNGGYTLPIKTGDVEGLDTVELSNQQYSLLEQNGFVVATPVPGEYREFYQIYEDYRYEAAPMFVTTDAVFHIYHLIFDKILRDLERDYFIPDLLVLTKSMLKTSVEQYQTLRGTALEDAAMRNVAYFGVADRLLGLSDEIPSEAQPLVDEELALIDSRAPISASPISNSPLLVKDPLLEDYSQYIPRGHYTRSQQMEQYFKAMMWYGRMTLRLREPVETRRALLMTQALRQTTVDDGRTALQLWQNIYDPTVFIVGKADDLSFYEYGAISDQVFGENPDLVSYADETRFAQFSQAARQLPPPQVNSMWVWIWEDRDEATQGFRFMGQRFTLDAYVFGQVMWRNVGTLDNQRDLPKGLDFLSAMGSDEALNLLNEMGENEYENYTTQMESVRKEVATLGTDSWTQNLYWSWLYAFQPIIEPKDERFPAFMRTQAWTRKDLHTALGSWTELKHDTILYAKQVMAELGGGGADEPPKGYVEPNPEAYARLLALATMTINGLDARGLVIQSRGALEQLIDLLAFLQGIAEKELAGEALTDDDYWRIKFFGGELEFMITSAADTEEGDGHSVLEDQKAALVADVATGIGRVLEEAVGQPTKIYVVLPDQPYRIGVGAVYSYYEFILPPDQRMNDEEWQAKVEAGDTPPVPDWTSMFMAP